MQTVNKIMLIGHVAADPDARETKNGKLVASFTIATNRGGYGSEKRERVVDYHHAVAWDRLAEICRDYVGKGTLVYVEGRLQNRSYQVPDGTKRVLTEMVVERLSLLSPKENRQVSAPKSDLDELDF